MGLNINLGALKPGARLNLKKDNEEKKDEEGDEPTLLDVATADRPVVRKSNRRPKKSKVNTSI